MTIEVEQKALVTATFSRRMTVQLQQDNSVDARIKGKRLKPVCGDRVIVRPIPNEADWLITEVLPRDNELSRPNSRGQAEVLAANLTFLCVLVADPPQPDWFIVDRYLCAAELMQIAAAVIFNKLDIVPDGEALRDEMRVFNSIGYATVFCSAKSGENIRQVERLLSGQISIVVGQSGVGKSSLINRLVDDADQKTAAVSTASGEGRHTTVNSVMLQLADGGAVIDSPGVRDYAPATVSPGEVLTGFREIAEFGRSCRFANCHHLREPGCAVKTAVDEHAISARRYESYRRLLALSNRLAEKRPAR
ncbi:MAG: ribosome small subunit-dependent GTPase A [Gammaproteobacteria bacterium]|nr:ribosome small subunit-dependent GTPase A [Gammaproteobacteria bacterium]MDH4315944.1 ribosome small subunit-dependent GTPase A [Gammaproteobacteria bacterium]MDH5213991.1 ribosome small subunit-dependent GTPase A [Gammaproteobacteria bacterium]